MRSIRLDLYGGLAVAFSRHDCLANCAGSTCVAAAADDSGQHAARAVAESCEPGSFQRPALSAGHLSTWLACVSVLHPQMLGPGSYCRTDSSTIPTWPGLRNHVAGVWAHDKDRGWFLDVTLGGRVGILRHGTVDNFRPTGLAARCGRGGVPADQPGAKLGPGLRRLSFRRANHVRHRRVSDEDRRLSLELAPGRRVHAQEPRCDAPSTSRATCSCGATRIISPTTCGCTAKQAGPMRPTAARSPGSFSSARVQSRVSTGALGIRLPPSTPISARR